MLLFVWRKVFGSVTVPGDKAENVVKKTCGGDWLEIDFRKNEDFSVQIRTRSKNYQSKDDRL